MDPRFKGGGGSRREEQQAIEEGIDIVKDAMRELLEKPQAEREAQLEAVLAQIQLMAGRIDGLGDPSGAAAERLKALEQVIIILKKLAASET